MTETNAHCNHLSLWLGFRESLPCLLQGLPHYIPSYPWTILCNVVRMVFARSKPYNMTFKNSARDLQCCSTKIENSELAYRAHPVGLRSSSWLCLNPFSLASSGITSILLPLAMSSPLHSYVPLAFNLLLWLQPQAAWAFLFDNYKLIKAI